MARFAKDVSEQKKLSAKNLYAKGFSYEVIADTMGISIDTLKKWGKEKGFEDARRASFLKISEIRNDILASFIDIREGRKPKIDPDKASKLVKVLETLNDKKKMLTYMIESFELLTQELLKAIEQATAKDKENLLLCLQIICDKIDRVQTKAYNEAYNE